MNTSGKDSPDSYVLHAAPACAIQREADDMIAHRWSFADNNLRGEYESFRDPGLLPEPHRSAFCSVTWTEGTQIYVVRSYHTPIAWYVPKTDEWVVPDVRYSVTTSRHQRVVAKAIAYDLRETIIDVATDTVDLGIELG